MRIISGIYRGQELAFPERDILRPTQEKVRAAVFNILQTQIEGCRFLDLCSGTGSVGIEALSRGAAHVHFVDTQTHLLDANLKHLKPTPHPARIQISQMPMGRFLSMLKPHSFDVIFCDPPWKEWELYTEALLLIAKTRCLSPSGVLFIEHHRDYPPLSNRQPQPHLEAPQEKPARSPRQKSHKHRLTGRELDEAEYMAMSGFGEKPRGKHKKNRDQDSVLEFDDTDGQWSPISKQAPRKQSADNAISANVTPPNNTIQNAYPDGFPLVVSRVYGYSDTHLTRMEYPRA